MKRLLILGLLLFASFAAAVTTESYVLEPAMITGALELDDHFTQSLFIQSRGRELSGTLSVSGNASSLVSFNRHEFTVQALQETILNINLFGIEETNFNEQELIAYPRYYSGIIHVKGDINQDIPLEIVVNQRGNKNAGSLILQLKPLRTNVIVGRNLRYVVDLQNVFASKQFDVKLRHRLVRLRNDLNRTSGPIRFDKEEINESVLLSEDNLTLIKSFSLPKDFAIEKNFTTGEYILLIQAEYLGLLSESAALIEFQLPFLKKRAFGFFPYWLILLLLTLGAVGFVTYKIIKHEMSKRKRFNAKVDYKEVPKEGPRSLFVGMIAETNKRAYFDMDILTVHSIVAGSTGGGKSIAAQDIVEEALIKGTAIVVFDPTAQWSGMLRKCVDKKMLSFYPNMGMKAKEARSFPGNIRAVKDGREVIDIHKYWKPGEIQVFTTSTLDPKDYDIFVANTVREIFHSNLQEFRGLRHMLVYDEIHRILPKFGGSGQGFIQIERGCREFRKWGIGILLISQVLQDFVGQIKANINTNVQMKTRDEGDLNRIKTNYGEQFIQALIKAPVGSGMVQNSAWNRGRPYYVTFRPILHSVIRLSDEELEKYNQYNDVVDDLEFQFEQLEKEDQDVFDLKLELKLAKDKVKSGNFNMVQIYLDGLTPRVEKIWNKIGKKPQKMERKLIDVGAMEAELQQAKEEHEQAADKEKQEKKKKVETRKEEKKEVKLSKEQIAANIESIGQLGKQIEGLILHKDWMTINDLLMEIKNIPLPKESAAKKEATVKKLEEAIELGKNPPKEEKKEAVKPQEAVKPAATNGTPKAKT
ncbi:DUF87 domain-containing protein [Candidatus Woesearchaeota archaeon]|nr:DUF87 domain-containing protein [Candidatus Woesearchaeota archaeon]